jgi:hypothetical protein
VRLSNGRAGRRPDRRWLAFAGGRSSAISGSTDSGARWWWPPWR